MVLFIFLLGCNHGLQIKSKLDHNYTVERSYFLNGNLEYEAQFLNGKLDGVSKVWLEDGTLISESNYSNGKPHGLWIKYHSNKSIMHKVKYVYGKKNGYERWFYDNGQIQSEQQFEHGHQTNNIIRWKIDGTLIY